MREKGIALILIVGILVLLSLAGAGMLGLMARLRTTTFLRLDLTQARLLAGSGLSFASARLLERADRPIFPTRENQADDWTYRDGPETPLEKSLNPSYARTEPYTDSDGNGRYDQGLDPLFTDLNGNGRFDAWSGRLRGGAGSAAVFLLEVASESAKVDLNAGMQGIGDVNGNGIPDCRDCDPRDEDDKPANFVNTSGDTVLTYEPAVKNVRIADTINLLGQAADGSSSSLQSGTTLLKHRPPGGYRSLGEAGRVLPAEDWESLRGHLSLFGTRHARRRTRYYRDTRVTKAIDDWPYGAPLPFQESPWLYRSRECVPSIDLSSADRPLLQALFTGLAGISLPMGRSEVEFEVAHLGFMDARRVADFLIQGRPFASRSDLFAKLEQAKSRLFPLDDPWAQSIKVNLVSANAEDDPSLGTDREIWAALRVPLASDFPSFSWCSYDLPRTLWPRGERRMERTAVDRRWAAPLPVPDQIPTASALVVSKATVAGVEYRDVETLPLSLDGPELFRITSLGRARGTAALLEGVFQGAEGIMAGSQADFENLAGRTSTGNGVWIVGRPEKVRTQTYPRFPLDSCRDLAGWPGGGFPTLYRFPDDYGTIALMAYTGYENGPENGQFFYQPCWEDGQPLREQLNPSIPKDSVECFRSVCPGSPSLEPSQPSFPTAGAPYRYDDPATELLFPSMDGIRNYNYWKRDSSTSPVLLPSTRQFTWPPGEFPWFDRNGAPQGGTIDFWASHLLAGLVLPHSQVYLGYLGFGLTASNSPNGDTADILIPRADSASRVFLATGTPTPGTTVVYQSIQPCTPGTYHRVIFTIDGIAETIAGYIDGILDPGLVAILTARALNPLEPTTLRCGDPFLVGMVTHTETTGGFNRGTGMRLYKGQPFTPLQILARSQASPFYWNRDLGPGDESVVPSFVSPLYSFPAAARLRGARWEGFVPEPIRKAAEEWNAGNPGQPRIPVSVELWTYTDAEGTQGKKTVHLPDRWWESGGGMEKLDTAAFRSLRYCIQIDSSAVAGFCNESPVINSVSFSFTSGKLLSCEWQ